MFIRIEQPSDYRKVEEITRDAFWNLYQLGADEHYLIHHLRKSPDFIPKLCLVAVEGREIVGNIAYSLSTVKENATGNVRQTITIGPISVSPTYQGKGIGSALMRESIKKAKEIGFKAIIIYGSPSYYERFGFKNGQHFGISDPFGNFPKALLVLQLQDCNNNNSLLISNGMFHECDVFGSITPEKVAEFDANFPAKPKFVTYSQKSFEIMLRLRNEDPVPPHVYEWLHRNEKFNE